MILVIVSVATDQRKKFHCLSIVLKNKTGPIIWNLIHVRHVLAFLKDSQKHVVVPLRTTCVVQQFSSTHPAHPISEVVPVPIEKKAGSFVSSTTRGSIL